MFVKELEITLENGMKISGELDLPERQGQWKTIILFHGSGPSDRHATVESMGGIVSRNFDLLSEGFVKARYAVFRYDKRENYDIEIIIRDAREVTRFVSGLSEVEGILLYGWSEGVRVCTTLVSDFPNAQALILQSGIAEGWSSYFSYILRELTVEKLKKLDNNNDSILEISDFLNCIPDSTSISFSLYLLILGTDKEGNMACVRNGKILPAQKRSPLNLPTRISKLSILPYVTEEIQEIIQGKYMLNIDSYTAAPVSLFSIVNKAHCQKKDLVNALMGQKNSNQKAFIWVRQNKGNDSRCIYFEGKNPSVLTGEILAITANAIFEMPRKDGIYTMASYLEKYQVLDELKKIDKFKSEGKI